MHSSCYCSRASGLAVKCHIVFCWQSLFVSFSVHHSSVSRQHVNKLAHFFSECFFETEERADRRDLQSTVGSINYFWSKQMMKVWVTDYARKLRLTPKDGSLNSTRLREKCSGGVVRTHSLISLHLSELSNIKFKPAHNPHWFLKVRFGEGKQSIKVNMEYGYSRTSNNGHLWRTATLLCPIYV